MVLTSFGLKNVPPNVVLLVEEDIGDIKSIFFQKIASDALKSGKKVHYISTRDSKIAISEQLKKYGINEKADNFTVLGNFVDPITLLDICHRRKNLCTKIYAGTDYSLHNVADADVCIIDMFSSLFIHEDVDVLTEALNSLMNISREANITFLLSADMGILPERSEKIVRSMVDGIIQFRTEYLGGKINRFINIPKMKGSIPMNKMIAYNVTSQGIMMDNRERVG